MANIKNSYRAASSVTVTLANLANGSGATSNAIDNSTNKDIEGLLEVKTNGVASGTNYLEVYIMDSNDGTEWSDVANARLVGVVKMNAASAVIKTLRIKDLPSNFKVHFINQSGQALSATGGDHVVTFQGIQYEVV
jgi:hypothetical protein